MYLIYYLLSRGELGKRVAVFYSASAFAGGFSGLIAYGVFQPNIRLHGWQVCEFPCLTQKPLPYIFDSYYSSSRARQPSSSQFWRCTSLLPCFRHLPDMLVDSSCPRTLTRRPFSRQRKSISHGRVSSVTHLQSSTKSSPPMHSSLPSKTGSSMFGR